MSRYLFVTWDGGGVVPPALGLAHELATRGHEVRFLGHPVQRARIEHAGFPFAGFERSPEFEVRSRTAPWYEPTPNGIRASADVKFQPLMVDDVQAEIGRSKAEVLVVEYTLRGALIAAEQSGLPAAALGNTFYGAWPHVPPEREKREIALLNTMREQRGLAPVQSLSEAFSRIGLVLMPTLKSLDPAAAGAPDTFRFVGPIFETPPAAQPAVDFWPERGRPLVLVSLTTVYHPEAEPLLQRILDGLAELPVQVLVTDGGVETQDPRVPPNAELRGFVPHAWVLPRVSLVVGHGGHATTMAALAHGVPLVPRPVD
jgi:MGT family glycosyltransferase